MPWRWWFARIAGVALIVLGAALFARSAEPDGAVPPPPPVGARFFGPSDPPIDPRPIPQPTPGDLRLIATQSVAPAPAVTPTAPSSTAPAAAPVITVTIPHDEHMHFTHVRHWHFPELRRRPTTPAKPAPVPMSDMAPPEPVRHTSPQAPAKWFGRFGR